MMTLSSPHDLAARLRESHELCTHPTILNFLTAIDLKTVGSWRIGEAPLDSTELADVYQQRLVRLSHATPLRGEIEAFCASLLSHRRPVYLASIDAAKQHFVFAIDFRSDLVIAFLALAGERNHDRGEEMGTGPYKT